MFRKNVKLDLDVRWPRGPKTWVCGRSLAGIAGSNPAEGMDVYLL